MLPWRRPVGYGLLALALAAPLVGYLERERIHFVGKCFANGNNLLGCSCTFSALPKLSANYQDLARSWALDPAGVHARSVLYAVAAEALKATTGLSKDLLGKSTDTKTYSSWLRAAAQSVGWPQTKQVIDGAAKVLVTTKATATVVVPVALAGTDFLRTRDTMKEYCGASPHFLTPIDQIAAAVATKARDSSQWVVNTAAVVSGAVSDSVIGGGNALTSFGRTIGRWVGLVRTDDAVAARQDQKTE